MKNKKQLAILKQGAEAWNAWRAEHRDIQPCFGREAADGWLELAGRR